MDRFDAELLKYLYFWFVVSGCCSIDDDVIFDWIFCCCCSINEDVEEDWILLFDNDDGDVELERDIVVVMN